MSQYQKRAAAPIDEKDKLLIAMIEKVTTSGEPLKIPAGAGCQSIRIGFYTLKKKLTRLAEKGEGDPETLRKMGRLTLTIADGVLTVGDSLKSGGFGVLGELLGGADQAVAAIVTQEEKDSAERMKAMLEGQAGAGGYREKYGL